PQPARSAGTDLPAAPRLSLTWGGPGLGPDHPAARRRRPTPQDTRHAHSDPRPRPAHAPAGRADPQGIHARLLAEETPAGAPGDSRLSAARHDPRRADAGPPRGSRIPPDHPWRAGLVPEARPVPPAAARHAAELDAAGAKRGSARRCLGC